ncbi:MAG: carboxypeptidase-like regulatory domain-containing protein, partial [Flavobacteriaceae bacterium]
MKKVYLAMVAFLFATVAFSQGTITGTVVDGETGDPLPGASVMERGTSNGVSTDFDGRFSIDVSSSSGTLVISYIGFQGQSVNYSSTGNIGAVTLR